MTISDTIWLATALLHMENAQARDFSVQEIIDKAMNEKLVDGFRPGLQVHVSKHCVANKSPNPARYRMLMETTRGRRRLFRDGDAFHPDREGGRIKPNPSDLPTEYDGVLRWYEKFYNHRTSSPPPTAFAPPEASHFSEVEVKDVLDEMSPQQLKELKAHIISMYTDSKSSKNRRA